MAAPRNRKHIIVPGSPASEDFKPHGRKIEVEKPPQPASRPSHGKALKTALQAAVTEAHRRREAAGVFRKRLNEKALAEDEAKPTVTGDSSEWYLGEQARNGGSIHSDMLSCPAEELAKRGVVAIYPVGGWWKYQPMRDRSANGARYALVVSIETPAVEADIWTPVAQEVGVSIELEAVSIS